VVVLPFSGENDTSSLVTAENVKVTTVVYRSELYESAARSEGITTLALKSSPLNIQLSQLPCDSAYCNITAIPQYSEHGVEENVKAAKQAEMNFTTHCTGDESGNTVTHYTCPDSGHVIRHNCSGVEGLFTSICPHLVPACQSADSSSSSDCTMVSYDQSSITCSCPVEAAQSSDKSRRRLDDAVYVADSGRITVVAVGRYIAADFADTFTAAPNTFTSLQRAQIVIFAFIVLWVVGFILIGSVPLRKYLLKGSLKISNMARKVKLEGDSESSVKIREHLKQYIKTIFPLVFDNKPRLLRLVEELRRHHRYLLIFTAAPGEMGDSKRFLSAVQLLTIQTMLLFLLALFYDLGSPYDDGSCEGLATESACLMKTSFLDSSQTFCQWVPANGASSSTAFTCSYTGYSISLISTLYIALIVSLIASVMMVRLCLTRPK
jgi:hypothetical protein